MEVNINGVTITLKTVKCEKFPNGEIRLTLYKEPNTSRREGKRLPGEEIPSPPNLSLAQNSKRSPNAAPMTNPGKSEIGYGRLSERRTHFSTYGRRTVLRAGAALEQAAPRDECYMITCTVPGSTEEALKAIAASSAYLVQRLKSWLCKRISNNLSLHCWEWQKRGALHLHLVIWIPIRSVAEYVQKNLKTEWVRLLNATAAQSGIDVWARSYGGTWKDSTDVLRVECAQVKKSVAAYLAKYISKGRRENKGFEGNFFYPSRWYGVSRPLLKLTRELSTTLIYTSSKLHEVEAMYEELVNIVDIEESKVHQWKHKVGNGKTTVSYSAKNITEYIWKQVVDTMPSNPLYGTALYTRSLRYCQSALALMKKRTHWQECFFQLSSEYVKNLAGNVSSSNSMNGLDLEYLLDTIVYAATWCMKTRSFIEGDVRLQHSTGVEILAAFKRLSHSEKLAMPFEEKDRG